MCVRVLYETSVKEPVTVCKMLLGLVIPSVYGLGKNNSDQDLLGALCAAEVCYNLCNPL